MQASTSGGKPASGLDYGADGFEPWAFDRAFAMLAPLCRVGLLVVLLARRTGQRVLTPVVGAMAAISALVGSAMWVGARAILSSRSGRAADLAAVMSMVLLGALAIAGLYLLTGVRRRLTERIVVPADPIDEDAVPAGGFA